MTYSAFFQPPNGWVGDVIPVEADGALWLYYLLERREEPKPGTPWALVRTKDFVRFDDAGIAFDHGGPEAADFNVYTGSIVRAPSGTAHLFYTGQNPRRLGADGLALQVVRRATSDDAMATWTRDPDWELIAPEGYETSDWRDPFVFRDEEAGVWRMLVAARHTGKTPRRSGLIAQLTSSDLVTWRHTEPFWDPGRYLMHECPDVFQWGDWWYLVYSEFTDTFTTRYRMARSPQGPWTVPLRDSVDGRAFYASKTVALDGRRFFVGWIASKQGAQDDGGWLWGGTMSTLEARQNHDGTLAFGLPTELVDSFATGVDLSWEPEHPRRLAAPDGYQSSVSGTDTPATFLATVVLDIDEGTTETGLLLRSSSDGADAYIVRLEPRRHRLVLDRWPRAVTGPAQWEISGDVPFELERPCDLTPGRHTLEVLADGDALVVVVDQQVALSARMYDRPTGRLGIFVGEGAVDVASLTVRARTDT